MLSSCGGLKIALPLGIVGYEATATANGLFITMVTLINRQGGEDKKKNISDWQITRPVISFIKPQSVFHAANLRSPDDSRGNFTLVTQVY